MSFIVGIVIGFVCYVSVILVINLIKKHKNKKSNEVQKDEIEIK